jgi:tRNA threonylcarbamoyladenosine biosynthesis protein TsaE
MLTGEWVTGSPEETLELGRQLATQLRPPVLVLLAGELGAGKTTLAKGLIAGLGAANEEDVTSPTFTLVHIFRRRVTVYHVDLYRIASFRDLETIGLEDIFAEPAVVVVEWPEKFTLRVDWPVVRVWLEHAGEDRRRIRVEAGCGRGGVEAGRESVAD